MTQYVAKRVYAPAEVSDGYRVLIDRLWPRGMSKDRAALDEWAKELAPSTELRKWFGHDIEKYQEFVRKYHRELDDNDHLQSVVARWSQCTAVTLLYGARDDEHNEVIALLQYLNGSFFS